MSGWIERADRRPAIIAHRGASTLGPENTAQAFRAAVEIGADAVETDVRLSADGVPVCFHDADLRRIAGDPRAVCDLSAQDFRGLVRGGMTLAEAAAILIPHVALMLDIKETAPARFAALLAALPGALAAGRIAFAIRRPELAAIARRSHGAATLLALTRTPDEIDAFVAAGCRWVRLWEADASADDIAALRRRGLMVTMMMGLPTATGSGHADATTVRRTLALGPDAICLDDAALALGLRG